MAAFPIIDSHVHLYAKTHLPRLNWTGDLPENHVLNRQQSVNEYRDTAQRCQQLQGFVFVETDRKHGLDEASWQDPLEEIAFIARIAQAQPIDGEGHSPEDSSLVLGMVPWAPLPAGPTALEKYIAQAHQVCQREETFALIKGFRYLLQDKPPGTMLQPDFIAGLQWLGDHDFSFDLGIDLRQGGIHQLQEACDMLQRIHRPGSKQKVIIDHFCKPDLHLTAQEAVEHQTFTQWSACMMQMAAHPNTFMKLSGFFSELPPQNEDALGDISEMTAQIRPWVNVVFSAFGPSRIMFGSDWPVCSAGGPGSKAWQHWLDLVTAVLDDQKLSDEDRRSIWSRTAARAYDINIPTRA